MFRSRSSNTSRSAAQKRSFAKTRAKPSQSRQSFNDFDFSTLEHARIEIEKAAPPRQSPTHPPPHPLRSSSCGTALSLKKQIKSRPSGSSPSFSSSSLKHNPTSSLGILEGDVNISAEDRLEAQKRELLAMKDWCGLKDTRPAKISFPDIADVNLIGKRRPVLKANGERLSRQGEKRPRAEAGVVKTFKTRKIYSDEGSDKSCRDFARKGKSCAARIAKNVEHDGRCSNSDEILLDTTIAAKYSGASFNSDENLFDLENDIQAFRQSPIYIGLSPRLSSTIGPSPLKNEIDDGDLACDERDGKFDEVSDLSQKHSLDSWAGRLGSRLLPESPSLRRHDSLRSTLVSSQDQQMADNGPHQSGTPPADSECFEECVTLSRAMDDGQHACIGIRPTETNFDLASVPKAGIPTTFPVNDTPPREKAKTSPLANATLSYINDLNRQLISQTSPTAASTKIRAEVADKVEVSPGPVETGLGDCTVFATQEARTVTREKSLSPETVWRRFVLGNSDDESTDGQYEFTLPSSPTPCHQQESCVNIERRPMEAEPSSLNAEPARSLNPASPVSTDELAPSPARIPKPKVFFTRPERFQGERSVAGAWPIRLGRRQGWSAMAYQGGSSNEDDVTDD